MRRGSKRAKSNSFQIIWLRISAMAAILAIVPTVILGIFFRNNWVKKEREIFETRSVGRLENISQTMQQNILSVQSDIQALLNNNTFQTYKKMSKPGDNVKDLQTVNNMLNDLCLKYPFVESAYYYNKNYDIIITNSYGTYEREKFYDTEWIGEDFSTYYLKQTGIRNNMNADLIKEKSKTTLSMYVVEPVITIVGNGPNSTKIAVNLSMKKWYRWLEQIYPFGEDKFYILDNKRIITMSDKSSDIYQEFFVSLDTGEDEMIETQEEILFMHSINKNMNGVTVHNKRELLKNASYFRSFIIILVICLAVVMAMLSVYLTKQIYSPVTEFHDSIRKLSVYSSGLEARKIEEEISYISSLYDSMEKNISDLSVTSIIQQRVLYRYRLRDSLIDKQKEDIILSLIMEENNITRPENYLMKIFGYRTTEKHARRNNIVEIIDTYMAEATQGIFFDIDESLFVALIVGETSSIIDYSEHVVERLLVEMIGESFCIGVSREEALTNDILSCYADARRCSEHAMFFQKQTVLFENIDKIPKFDIKNQKSSVIYESLEKLVQYKHKLDIEEILRELNLELQGVQAEPEYIKNYYVSLLSFLFKKFDYGEPFDISTHIYELNTLKEVSDLTKKLICELIDNVESKEESCCIYTARAQEYIQAHYREDVSVVEIADSIGISYTYLSKLFKEESGIGLLEYLNQTRIEKSKNLLVETQDTLAVISEKVGFNNPQSYQRHFRRLEGATPGEYRKQFQAK